MSAQMRPENGFLCDGVRDTIDETDPEFEALLDYLKHNWNCDLTGYKRSTLTRRFQHRMQSINVISYQDYLQYLQSHSEEWKEVLDTVLINFSSFFRDRDTWDYLASDIIPKIIASRRPNESIRVWSAGCASGEEIYSLAILFAQALGIESCLKRVRFFATDLDENAIQKARLGIYSSNEVAGIPLDLLQKYFEIDERRYVFNRKIRNQIVFGHHNLAQDAPMSKIELLLCRNVLMYFEQETQASILIRFHYALKNTGFLFLGMSETLTNRRQIFQPVSIKHHVYKKKLKLELEDRLSIDPKPDRKREIDATTRKIHIWQTAYERSPFAQLAVNFNGRLIVANQQAIDFLGLTIDDLNRPFEELELGKLIDSYVSLKTFKSDRSSVTLKNIEWMTSEGKKYLDIFITPVFNQQQYLLAVNLTFIDLRLHPSKISTTPI